MSRAAAAWLVPLAAVAWGAAARADDDDDPAFATHAPSPTTRPATPAQIDDDDPGFAPSAPVAATQPASQPTSQPATLPATTMPARPRRKREPEGIGTRFSYLTFTLPETLRSGVDTERFHSLAVDVYPISWWLRVGLSTRLGTQVSRSPADWLFTEGILVGVQRPGASWTPYLEGGLHVGVGTRTFYIAGDDLQTDRLTMFWMQSIEAGVDARVYQKTQLSVGVGAQHTSYVANGTDDALLAIDGSWSVTIKLGVGY